MMAISTPEVELVEISPSEKAVIVNERDHGCFVKHGSTWRWDISQTDANPLTSLEVSAILVVLLRCK